MSRTSCNLVVESEMAVQSVCDYDTDTFSSSENSNITFITTIEYISKILEEETDCNDIQEGHALWAVEKPFYDVLDQNYPLLQNNLSLPDQSQPYSTSQDASLKSQTDASLASLPVLAFKRGVEDGMHHLRSIKELSINSQADNNMFRLAHKDGNDRVKVNFDKEENENQCFLINRSKGKKKLSDGNLDLTEGRNCKISVPNSGELIKDTTYDEMLLYPDKHAKQVVGLRKMMQMVARSEKKIQQRVVDVKDLLVRCSLSVAANDHQAATQLIKEIRKQSSPNGDGNQRLALVLADALEARLTGSESYQGYFTKRPSVADKLKFHHLFTTINPCIGNSFYFANQIILKAIDKASKLHIIDFGVDFGLQWPSLIQLLSKKKTGAVKLQITGIDFPQPGFRPAELVEETGRRLKEYAKMLNVPFEYHGIASQWETIRVADLQIEKDEVLIVYSMYRFAELEDETTNLDCARDQVLKLIRQVRPYIFIHGIYNWSVSSFFVTRFKQTMSLYELLFNLWDTFVPRDNKIRQIAERDLMARRIINSIACEGSAQKERHESYKQWHRRNMGAGLEQIPLDSTVVKKCEQTIKEFYNGLGYSTEVENNWFLQGWRGRIIVGLSTWKSK